MQYPKISIVTPSYNQGKFIAQTIDSVLNQKYPNLEYWVIDGGSTDNTVEILKSYGTQIQWVSEKDHGQTEAINKGFHLASGEIVAFLNSDDYYLPGTLLKVADSFQKTNCMWLTGNYHIVDEENQPIQAWIPIYKQFLQFFSSRFMLSITNYINQPSTFWRREAFEQVGYFNEDLQYVMDYDFWMRMIRKYPLKITHDVFSSFRIHHDSKGGSQYIQQFDEEIMVLQRYNPQRITLFLHKVHNLMIVSFYKLIKTGR
jgi:glycosyltransferase involved in cell wall biosynthesis